MTHQFLHRERNSPAAAATPRSEPATEEKIAGRAWRRFRESPWSPRLAALTLVMAMVLSVAFAFAPFNSTPSVKSETAPATVFSAERADDDLRAVASQPRSIGTPAHAETVDTIRSRLADMGVESGIVEDVVARPDFNQVFAGRLTNIIARIPGTNSSGAVLLLAHFDSVPTSLNANDGGLGVATLLETVRAIQAGPAMENDILLWFGDADETTSMNTRILQQHPWFDDVEVGFAFEGIGADGPSLLTYAGQGDPDPDDPVPAVGENEGFGLANPHLSTDNGLWLREALDVVPHPVVALAFNDPALAAGPDLGTTMWGSDIGGVSFAQIGDSSGYHTDLDNPDNVSLASLQDAGDTSLALTRHFGDFDFDEAETAGGLIAFNVLPGRVVTYSTSWAVPLALLLTAALGAVLTIGIRRHRLTITGILAGIGLTILSLIAVVVVVMVVSTVLQPDVHFARNAYSSGWRFLLVGTLTLAVVSAVFAAAARFVDREQTRTALAAGPLVVLTLIAIVTATALSSLSYVVVWPTLAGVAFLGWRVRSGPPPTNPWAVTAALSAVGFIVMLGAVPVVYLLGAGLSISQPMFAALVAFIAALLAVLLVPHFQHLAGERGWIVPLTLLAAALMFAIVEQATNGFDADQPSRDYIQYTLDADTGDATWLSAGTDTDAWTQQFFTDGRTSDRVAFSPGYFYDQEFDVIEAPAPPVDIPAPQLTVLEDTTTNGVRTLDLRIGSPRRAAMAHLDLDLPGALVAASVDGTPLEVDPDIEVTEFPIAAYNPGSEGIEISISVNSSDPIHGSLADFTNGLPDLDTMTYTERPDDLIAAPYDFRDPTVVRTTINI